MMQYVIQGFAKDLVKDFAKTFVVTLAHEGATAIVEIIADRYLEDEEEEEAEEETT